MTTYSRTADININENIVHFKLWYFRIRARNSVNNYIIIHALLATRPPDSNS